MLHGFQAELNLLVGGSLLPLETSSRQIEEGREVEGREHPLPVLQLLTALQFGNPLLQEGLHEQPEPLLSLAEGE